MTHQARDMNIRRAIRQAITGTAMGAVWEQMLLQGGLLALLVLTLGGSRFQAGLAFTLNFLAQIVRVLAAPRVDTGYRRRFVVRGLIGEALLHTGFLLTIPVYNALGAEAAVWFVLAIYAGARVVFQWGNAAWFPLLSEIVPSSLRGRFFGRLRTAWRITTTIGVVLTGWWLGEDPALWRFYPVLVLGLLLSAGRVVMISRLPDVPPARTGAPEPILRNLRRPMSDPPFRRFLVFLVLMGGASGLAMPYLVPYLRLDLAFPSSWTMYATVGLGVGSILSLIVWGQLTDRWGNRLMLLAAHMLRAAGYLCFALTPSFAVASPLAATMAAAGFLLLGVGMSGGGLANTVRLMHAAPASHRAPYMALFSTTAGLANAAGALIGGAVLELMPRQINWYGLMIESSRLYYGLVVGLMLLCGSAVRLLTPVRERGLMEVTGELSQRLPGPTALPVQLAHQLIRRERARRLRRERLVRHAEINADEEVYT